MSEQLEYPMKLPLSPIVASLFGLVSLAFSGCATTGGTGTNTPNAAALGVIRAGVAVGATLEMQKNPKIIPTVAALEVGIDAALVGGAAINETTIEGFINKIAAKNNLSPVEVVLFTNLARTAYQAYIQQYSPNVVFITDPNARLYIKAFRDGLDDAILAVQNTPPRTAG